MPRYPRQQSATGIYHVMARGIDRSDIFHDRQDRMHYLYTLARAEAEHRLSLHAYCLMSNHVHLLLSEGDEALGETMRRIGTSYAYWFNTKYGRVGYLFQGRYRSEPIDNDAYFITVFRYVHQNPVKTGLCDSVQSYEWSSYPAYSMSRQPIAGLVDKSLALGILGGLDELMRFVNAQNTDACLDIQEKAYCSDAEIHMRLNELLGGRPISSLMQMHPVDRARLLCQLKGMGASNRQISRLTGLNRNIIQRA